MIDTGQITSCFDRNQMDQDRKRRNNDCTIKDIEKQIRHYRLLIDDCTTNEELHAIHKQIDSLKKKLFERRKQI